MIPIVRLRLKKLETPIGTITKDKIKRFAARSSSSGKGIASSYLKEAITIITERKEE